ncbi:MAG: SulP family inorganic anion transporter [Myxococcota bacterium]
MDAGADRDRAERTSKTPSEARVADVLASVVVFLVALPLCIGIAVACGVPPERGLVTGIVGGIVVGAISGAPLLVSGPAASLIVPVFDLVRTHGILALAPVVMLAGVWQGIAGALRLGQWFRAVAPAVIHGMLIGIGALIFASQLHVAVDSDPKASFLENLIALPGVLVDQLSPGGAGPAPFLISSGTIVLLVAWNRYRPQRLKLVPGHLIAVAVVTGLTVALDAPVKFLDISPEFVRGLAPVSLEDFGMLRDPALIGLSFMFAFVASAATLLTANAIDQRQTHSQANYNREMMAQGVGNVLTGALGGLPMTGVIVRSSVNVDAGARTRLSTFLHGIWILVFVMVAPQVLERIPQASLGAILVYTGYKLIDLPTLVGLYRHGRGELVIGLITLVGVVFVELFVGILAGLAAALGKIVYTFARLQVRSEPRPSEKVHDLHLAGSATFLQLPRLVEELDAVPRDRELHIHIDRLDHIDHACLELLSTWNRRREAEGLPGMVVEWDELTDRYRQAVSGAGAREAEPSGSLLRLVWAEWRRAYAPQGRREDSTPPDTGWIDAERVRTGVEAASLDDVLTAAAEVLARAADRPAAELGRVLRRRVEGHVALGEGVSIPHASLAGLERPVAALVTTRNAVDVSGEPADLFFVMLAPEADPQQHLRALAHVARLCHDASLLEGLRNARTPDEVVGLLDAAERSLAKADSGVALGDDRVLVVLEVEGDGHFERVAEVVGEAFQPPVVLPRDAAQAFDPLRHVLSVPASRLLLLLPMEENDLDFLRVLLDEQSRVAPDGVCRLHVLRPEDGGEAPAPLEAS